MERITRGKFKDLMERSALQLSNKKVTWLQSRSTVLLSIDDVSVR